MQPAVSGPLLLYVAGGDPEFAEGRDSCLFGSLISCDVYLPFFELLQPAIAFLRGDLSFLQVFHYHCYLRARTSRHIRGRACTTDSPLGVLSTRS